MSTVIEQYRSHGKSFGLWLGLEVTSMIEQRIAEHRYPECITIGELLQAHPELHRADVVAVLKDLQTRGAVQLRQAINDLTIYLNNEKA